jgi:hypothetical protein
MRPLFIHSDNTSLLNKIDQSWWDTEKFVITDYADIDFQLHDFIVNKIANKISSAIFIKLALSDNYLEFIGLRLGLHIRLTDQFPKIQNLPIVFLGEEKIEELFRLFEYPEFLISQGVYISTEDDPDFHAIADKLVNGKLQSCLSINKFLGRINIKPTDDTISNHSISNEWSIYQWSKTLSVNNDVINSVIGKVKTSLYFKYLATSVNLVDTGIVDLTKLKLRNDTVANILLVDDDADKGWYELLCVLLSDINNLENFNYLGEELKHHSKNEIVEIVVGNIIENNIDIVILDFRIHPSDYEVLDIEEVTGVRILRAIKKLNPGIQIIIFSATEKVWNLQLMQKLGINAFVLKDSPRNSGLNPAIKSISHLVSAMDECLGKLFLKDFYIKYSKLQDELIPRKRKKNVNCLPADFVDEVLKWFELSCSILLNDMSISSRTASFLFLFSVLENLSNRLIDVDNPIEVPNTDPIRYMFEFRSSHQKLKKFTEDKVNLGYYRKTTEDLKTTKRVIPWLAKIQNAIEFVSDDELKEDELSNIVKTRNDLIHANTTTGKKAEITAELLISLNKLVYDGLIKIV